MTELVARTVDYHTAGEPFRIITGGVDELEGATILDKRRFAAEHVDHVRSLLVNEPRGHADMYGCFVTQPNDEGADLGVVFFHNAGYSTACGHGTIALVAWAIDDGVIEAREPETRVVVDVPSGRLETVARVRDGSVRSVRFTNVPSYVAETDVALEALGGLAEADVAFGGAFYASVDADALGLSVEPGNVTRFIELGRAVKHELEAGREFVHPLEPELNGIYGVIFFQDEPDDVAGPALVQRNVTVFADGEVDRSPCGSGTSARIALHAHRGRLDLGDTILHRSMVGTEFVGTLLGRTQVGELPAVITAVEGSAHRTGEHAFVLDPADPLGTGFLLR